MRFPNHTGGDVKPVRLRIVLVCILVIICIGALIYAVISENQNNDFSIASFEQGQRINNNDSLRTANYITLDKADYSFNEDDQKIANLKGIISVNATVFADKEIKAVTYSTSQSNVAICSSLDDSSADLNEVISRGKKSITFSDSARISYSLIGIIIQSDKENEVQKKEITDSDIIFCLLNCLEPDFLTVEVKYTDGSSANRQYSLSAQINDNGDLVVSIKEADSI